ncbi:hypothetical protein E0F20_09100 [Citrobacter freundii]|nr:hypothetical protein [Citrobacter freundii]RVR64037.1 hypothetical protein EOL25_01175 [Citrobacter freundii]TBV95364.1 hypothetical protein E0E99_09120 [Citrobacter freundii]TBW04220.1 hypothetical protein E0F20_09100 [Citrobacter freundii]
MKGFGYRKRRKMPDAAQTPYPAYNVLPRRPDKRSASGTLVYWFSINSASSKSRSCSSFCSVSLLISRVARR